LCYVFNITTEPPTTGQSVSCVLELPSWFGVELRSKYMKDNVAKYMMHVSNTGRYDEVRIPATYCRGLGFKFWPGYNLCDFHVL